MEHVTILTDENFKNEVIEAGVPVLVDFWAPWCAPCRMVAPVIEAVAEKFAGRAKVAKLNVDEHQGIASSLNIMSIPTVMLFKGNEAVDMRVGAQPQSDYEAMLDTAINEQAA